MSPPTRGPGGRGSAPQRWRSGFYRGRVHHVRLEPLRHQFAYGHFLAALDLDELPELFRGRWLWSAERFNLASFRRADHLGDPAVSLQQSVRELVQERTGERPAGRILLLTQLRHFGYVFNPVSFFFCFDRDDRVQCVVAEINNTPWGEQHCYVLPAREGQGEPARSLEGEGARLSFRFGKEFHISPFFPMEQEYHWEFSAPGERLSIGMRSLQQGRLVFSTHMTLDREAWSAAAAARALLSHPWMSFKTVAAIYWQALRLRLKGAPFFPHPGEKRPARPPGELRLAADTPRNSS
ncbi:MAG: DUF1365 domain-containing protein [Planctomycetes bacterium]|nr:DUF1365 domain-containing protein [Planctomycetota bacterium]